jgi:hypothetical protein
MRVKNSRCRDRNRLLATVMVEWTDNCYTPAHKMDSGHATRRAVVLGHLTITIPVIAVIWLVVRWSLYQFGPSLWPYYVTGGIALAWQWYLMALPQWKGRLTRLGLQVNKPESVAERGGLVWPGSGAIGSFGVHTTIAAICGIQFGPWLLSRWYARILPLLGMSSHSPTGNDWLQHFELVSIVPAFVVGYLLSKRFGRLATWAWILPTIILAYELLRYTEPNVSVLAAPHPSTRFQYFFVIQRTAPTFTPGFGGVDPVRIALQMSVVAPFYAGLAYSAGALAAKRDLLQRIFGSGSMQPEAESSRTEMRAEGPVPDESEKPVHELD